jgi:hypothetical protein
VHVDEVDVLLLVRVEAGRDEEEVRPEARDHRLDELLEGPHPFRIPAAGAQRHVHGGRAALPLRARSRVDADLVQRCVENRVVARECVLRAVPVVDVEVDDRHPLHAVLHLHVPCRDRDVVHEAEAHRAARRSVMAGRSHERERAGLRRFDRAARSQQASLPARLRGDRVRIVEPRRLAQLLQDF